MPVRGPRFGAALARARTAATPPAALRARTAVLGAVEQPGSEASTQQPWLQAETGCRGRRRAQSRVNLAARVLTRQLAGGTRPVAARCPHLFVSAGVRAAFPAAARLAACASRAAPLRRARRARLAAAAAPISVGEHRHLCSPAGRCAPARPRSPLTACEGALAAHRRSRALFARRGRRCARELRSVAALAFGTSLSAPLHAPRPLVCSQTRSPPGLWRGAPAAHGSCGANAAGVSFPSERACAPWACAAFPTAHI